MMAARSHPEPALALGGAWPQAARPAAVAEPPLLRFVVVPVFGRRAWSRQSAALAAKRALDLLGAALLLLLLAPLLAAIAAAVRLTSPGPALFAQTRIGLGCRPFRMLKFRSMVAEAERLETVLARASDRTFLEVKDDQRVTGLGRWLRRYSLDELPQLWNVLWGEMSLVGPRLLLLGDLERTRASTRRFAMPPGLTGLWQVSGRSDLDDAARIQLDLAYVEGWSLALDLKLLARTMPAVLSGDGAY